MNTSQDAIDRKFALHASKTSICKILYTFLLNSKVVLLHEIEALDD
jgi:hypothetical protein